MHFTLSRSLLGILALLSAGVVLYAWSGSPSADPGIAGGAVVDARGAPSGDGEIEVTGTLGPWPVTLIPGVHLLGGVYPNAAYVIESGGDLTLVDTCPEPFAFPILSQMRSLGLDVGRLRNILLTHGHADHVMGARRLREISGARIHAGRGDAKVIRNGGPREALCSVFDMDTVSHGTEVDVVLDGGEELRVGDDVFRVLATPGHTPGSVCYLLERQGLRILFTGDTILSLGESRDLTGAGVYSATLAPCYGGDAVAFEKSLRMLLELPVPDLVLPGHPRNDLVPESPRPAAWWWKELLERGIARVHLEALRRERDGADFLDGTARELLPGVHYRGDHEGVAVYSLTMAEDGLCLVNAPGDPRLLERVLDGARAAGLEAPRIGAVLLPSCAPEATAGLRSLLERVRCPVYAPPDALDVVRALCPPDTDVREMGQSDRLAGLTVRTFPVEGLPWPSAAYLFTVEGRSVLISGRIPDAVTVEPEDGGLRWSGPEVEDADAVLRSLRPLDSVAPDLWLPVRPLADPNANLYDDQWQRILLHNRACLAERRAPPVTGSGR